MKRYAWLALGLLSLLTACPGGARKEAGPAPAPDYDATRRHSQESQQSLDREKAPGQE